jgi:hypothetical protein
VSAHVRLHEALRTQWDGGCFHALPARFVDVQVGDVLVVGGAAGAALSEATVWGSERDPCEDQCRVIPCITCMDDSCFLSSRAT